MYNVTSDQTDKEAPLVVTGDPADMLFGTFRLTKGAKDAKGKSIHSRTVGKTVRPDCCMNDAYCLTRKTIGEVVQAILPNNTARQQQNG